MIALVIVLTSCFEQLHFQVAGQTIRPVHLLAIGVLVCLLILNSVDYQFLGITLLFVLAVFLASLPSVFLYGSSRFSTAIQLAANLTVFLALRELLWKRPGTTAWLVKWCTLLVIGMAVVQWRLLPNKSLTSRFLGLVRPSAFFEEPTWLAIFLAVAALAALQVGSRWIALAAGLLVLELGTRSAIILLGIGLLIYAMQYFRLGRGLSRAVIFAAWAGSMGIFLYWYNYPPVARGNQSLDTRQLDVFVVRKANSKLMPWGGADTHVFDPYRERMVPDTSNVLPLDLVWKLGIGGVALIIIVLLFSFTCFRVAGVRREQLAASPALAVVILIVPVCVFNNAMGRPWTWALLAVCLAAWRLSSIDAAGDPASQGELRPTVHSKSVAGGRDSD